MITAQDVLGGKKFPGDRVAVIGGGATGCETANYLGAAGKKVTVIEALFEIGKGEEPARKIWLMKSLAKYGVKIEANASVKEISDVGEIFVLREGGRRESLGIFDTIVAATGVRSYDPLSKSIRNIAAEVYAKVWSELKELC